MSDPGCMLYRAEKHMRNVGKMALANTLSYVQAAKAVLIDAGYGQAEVEGLGECRQGGECAMKVC